MRSTDIGDPDYFHKVVDCQWACPAHTPVPEYIRLIAAGRYTDAYLVNWESNVFPGILGRTCDRPCEPACRRGRVEEAQAAKPEPVAICRLKRVAADFKDDIAEHLPRVAPRNGKRIACVGGGPASLTVARDLAPLGYEVVVFDGDAQAGGMIRSQIPRFRLPEEVIDEETGYVLKLGVEFRGGTRIDSMRALLAEGWDAVFVGSGAPRGRDLSIPGRSEAAAHIHIGIDWLSSVSFGHVTSIGQRVIVLGGGNTAMDCCRSSKRLGGSDVKVIVRSPFDEMKASPWEKEDAIHEGIPILDCLVPKAFLHSDGKLTGMSFDKVRAVRDDKGRRQLDLDRRARAGVRVRRRAGRRRPGERLSLDRARRRHRLRRMGHAGARPGHAAGRACRASSSAATPRSARRTSSGQWRRGMPRRSRSTSSCTAKTSPQRPAPGVTLVSQKMGIHEWSYDNDITPDLRSKVPWRDVNQSLRNIKVEVELGFDVATAWKEAQRCLNCDVQTVFNDQPVHRVRRLRRHLPDRLHHLHRQRRRSRPAHAPACAGAPRRARISTSPTS